MCVRVLSNGLDSNRKSCEASAREKNKTINVLHRVSFYSTSVDSSAAESSPQRTRFKTERFEAESKSERRRVLRVSDLIGPQTNLP